MWKRLVFVFGIFLITALFSNAGEKPTTDAKTLQGTWKIIELEANGEKKPAEDFEGWKVVVKGDDFWLEKPSGLDPKLKFKLDRGKSPNTIDLTVQEGKDKGQVAPGIYAFDNGKLRLCINIFGDRTIRPKEFKTQDHDGTGYAILVREKTK